MIQSLVFDIHIMRRNEMMVRQADEWSDEDGEGENIFHRIN
jgi:hypothetical protein